MTKLDSIERKRTYTFPGGDIIEFKNVSHIKVSASGCHRLQTGDGLKHIVNTGWISITLEVDEWTI